MFNLKTEESFELNTNIRNDLQMQKSDRKFVLHANLNEISSKKYYKERRLVLPQIYVPYYQTQQSEDRNPGIHILRKQLECIKLPEIDEKFFIKKSNNTDLIKKPKIYSHSHQVSREEFEFFNSDKNINYQFIKKVDFQDNVMIYDYVNQTQKKDCINGQGRSIKLRRLLTRKISDDLTKQYKKENNLYRLNTKSHFFQENEKEQMKLAINEQFQIYDLQF
ncbi:unnamed protein product [Paramecium pentaurelia]|uniref:Uncharacterized protein n=1 Tax=Paramecium pentaurelia TaxID=43138 RepID=A0A8S1WZY7_9CILI|nr:unnamed protein product [Paramecium pentaurelia]